MLGFGIWLLVGLGFMGLGIYSFIAKKAVSFWANVKTVPIDDVKAYNKAAGKVWCLFSMIFIFLGLPLLSGQNQSMILFSIMGIFIECIVLMAIMTKIENKYRKK